MEGLPQTVAVEVWRLLLKAIEEYLPKLGREGGYQFIFFHLFMRICIMLFFSIFHCHLPINSHLLMNYEIQYWFTNHMNHPLKYKSLRTFKVSKFTIHKMWPPQNLMILQCLNKVIKGYVFWIVYSVICTFQLFHKACYYILPESLGYDWYFHFALHSPGKIFLYFNKINVSVFSFVLFQVKNFCL